MTSTNPEVFIGQGLSVISSLDGDKLNELVIPTYFGNEQAGYIHRAEDVVDALNSSDVSLRIESLFDVEELPEP